jgi:hypothetical protein
VNYRSDEPAVDVRVSVALPAGAKAEKVTLVSPDQQEDVNAQYEQAAGGVRFIVPKVQTYTIAIVSE